MVAKPNPLGFDAVTKALREHGSKSMADSLDDVYKVAIAFDKETDRGAVILATTAFEDRLHRRLLQRFKPLNSIEKNDLFGFEAPLGTFSAKIRIAHALGIIDKPMRNIADVIRAMRNTCAHSGQAASFKDAVLLDAVDYMLQQLGYNGDELRLRDRKDERPDWPRFVFLMVIDALLVAVAKKTRSKKPTYSGLFSTYLAYMAAKEGWTPQGSRTQSSLKVPPPRIVT